MTPPCPGPGEVHIRLFNLAVSEAQLAGLEQLLALDERERSKRLINRQVRNRYIAGRGLLRETLADCLDREPGDLCLKTNPYGKPFLSGEHVKHGLSFNLSHSGDLAILALCEGCELGIDLEQLREDLPFKAMAQQFFSLREQADLFSLPAGLQPAAFYRCWTRKEAYLKGVGSGFSQPADICDVSLFPDQPPVLIAHQTNPTQPSKWSLIDLDVPQGFCAALAIQKASGAYAAFSRQKPTQLIFSRG